MLTPQQLKDLPAPVIAEFRLLEDEIIRDVSERIGRAGKVSATSANQLQILYSMGNPMEIDAKLSAGVLKLIKVAEKEMQAGSEITPDMENLLKFRQREFEQDLNYINNVASVAKTRMKNEVLKMSKTKGFVIQGDFVGTGDILNTILNRATIQSTSGAFTFRQIAERYIRMLGDSGIRTIDYESGRTYAFESQLKRIIIDSSRNMANTVNRKNAEDLGTDLMEISAHAGARPSHAEWQGQILSLEGRRGYLTLGDIGEGDVDGFGGANCRHTYFPYFEGMPRNYTEEELEEFKNETVEVDGQKIPLYEATQTMRRFENSIRKSKRRLQGFDGLGSQLAYEQELTRLRRLRDGYKSYGDKTGIWLEPYSLQIYSKR